VWRQGVPCIQNRPKWSALVLATTRERDAISHTFSKCDLSFRTFLCVCARKCSRVRCLNTWPPDLLETVCSYRRIHMDYSSAHVIFIIQYCNRLLFIAVDYTTDLVPKTNAFASRPTAFVQLRKNKKKTKTR